MKQFVLLAFSLLIWNSSVFAQQTPAPAQTQAILIEGATAHLGNGQVMTNSMIAFENGKITLIEATGKTQAELAQTYQIIDATGKHVYPGFIAPATTLGLGEIDAVRSTQDSREVGELNASVRSIIAYNTDSRVTPTVRSNGVLMAQVMPRGGRISGLSSVVQLDAWNWEDAAYATDNGLHLHWPRSFRWTGWWAEPGTISKNEKYDEQVREIETFFAEARAYAKVEKPSNKNLKLESMRKVLSGETKLFIHTDNLKEMMAAVHFARQQKVTPVLVGARDAWRMIDFLQENKVEIVLDKLHSLPAREDEDVDQPFKTAAALYEAGIPFCFSLDGSWEQRNLAFQAGQAIAYGLPYEAAVAAITGEAANILGIGQKTGTLEIGKDATLFISAGDALDMRSCQIEKAFIQGREIDLENKQKALAKKFKAKYESSKE